MTASVTEVALLVGGEGTRLRAVVSDRPKPMAEVAGKPLLEWLLMMWQQRGVERAVLCTGYMGDVIEAHFGDGSRIGLEIEYSPDPYALGTGGSIRHALDKLQSDLFYAMNGDSYIDVDTESLLATHMNRSAPATILAAGVADISSAGSVQLSDEGDVVSFQEKTGEVRPGLINSGAYLLERSTIESIPHGVKTSIETEVFPTLVGKGLSGVVAKGPFIDIGTPETYAAAEAFFAENVAIA